MTQVLAPPTPPPVKAKSGFNLEISQARIKPVHLMHLSRQLSSFLRAGEAILNAVQTIADEGNSAVKRVMTQIGTDLRAGSTLSEAVNRHPKDFPAYYRGILASAELTGQLDTVLDQLSSYIERDVEAKRKIKQALIYPSVVALMAAVTVVVLSVFVLPKFEVFFQSLDAELPLPTRMLLNTTAFLSDWWWALLSGAAGFIVLLLLFNLTAFGKKMTSHFWLKVPVIGTIVRYAMIERFSRLVSSMVGAGVMLPEALEVTINSMKNRVFTDALTTVRVQLMEGRGLADPINDTDLFKGFAGQMIRVGEETGSLETQLDATAQFYSRELDYKITKATTLIEPIVILGMGGLVGFVAVALVSAMYGIFRSANLG